MSGAVITDTPGPPDSLEGTRILEIHFRLLDIGTAGQPRDGEDAPGLVAEVHQSRIPTKFIEIAGLGPGIGARVENPGVVVPRPGAVASSSGDQQASIR